MTKMLVDTSVIIDFLRQKNKAQTLFYSLAQDEPAVSIVTHSELYSGKSVWQKKSVQEELEVIFSGLTCLPLTEQISMKAGQLRAQYNVSLFDCIIAATALWHDLPLVTLNTKDFSRFKGLKLYPLN